MAVSEKNKIDTFHDSSRSDMLNTLFRYELEVRTTAADDRREWLQGQLEKLWPEYLEI